MNAVALAVLVKQPVVLNTTTMPPLKYVCAVGFGTLPKRTVRGEGVAVEPVSPRRLPEQTAALNTRTNPALAPLTTFRYSKLRCNTIR
jgi:hypothetical protein